MSHSTNNFPKLHNAMWPGLVGKGSPGAEPCLDLDTMLNLTAAAEVDGIKFDGVDVFLFAPHIDIDISDDGLRQIADKIASKGLVVGSVVAPIWPPTGGGSAMGSEAERKAFVGQVRKGCRIAAKLREFGVRPHGVVRIDSASGVTDWAADPDGNTAKIAQTFSEACDVADEFGERLAAEGEICWGGMHSWRSMVKLLEAVDRPLTLGFQADMAHTLLFMLGYNAPEDSLLPPNFDWQDQAILDEALKKLTQALRPWTIDFHVAQNDATVKGSGTHDKTGHHCLAVDPNGKLDIPKHAGFWLREEDGKLTKAFRHICWDGCMFPNEVMMKPETWNDILAAMIAVRDLHGWREEAPAAKPAPKAIEVSATKPSAPAPKPAAKPLKPTGKPAAKPAVKAPAKKTAKPAAKKPAKKIVKKADPKKVSAKRPAKKPARKPAKAKATKPAKKALKARVAKSARKPVKKIAPKKTNKRSRRQ